MALYKPINLVIHDAKGFPRVSVCLLRTGVIWSIA